MMPAVCGPQAHGKLEMKIISFPNERDILRQGAGMPSPGSWAGMGRAGSVLDKRFFSWFLTENGFSVIR